MSTVLGLSFFYHDSAAALVRDGSVAAAAAEERFCRRKHTSEFPKLAIEYCLEAAEVRSVNDLDAIVFYEKPALKLQRIVESLVSVWPRGLHAFARDLPTHLTSKFNVYREIEKTLPGYKGQILFTEHHMSHAASAFYCSPFEEAAILTMDGIGESESTTIGYGREKKITLDRAIHFPHSIGLLYSALTGYLGFHVNDGEWKVMGLAPYGKPQYVEQFRKLVHLRDDGSFQLDMKYFVHQFYADAMADDDRWRDLFGFPRRFPGDEIEQVHMDLARSGQFVVEEMILNLAREAKRSSGSENLVIAGGVGLNSVANWRIEQEALFENVWIQPASGDDGGAMGAALLVSQDLFEDELSPELKQVYLGPEFSNEEIRDFLKLSEIEYTEIDDAGLVERIADFIAQGKVIGWFQGRMEFGPRALGNRSILADASNPDMKRIINEKIKYREFFRPFAPAVLLENVHEYFEVDPGTEMPFMLKVPKVRPEMCDRIPAVTHEDGSGRVQTVSEASNPLYYRLIQAVGRRVGVPIVINTSFNVRGQPIVCTPKDALGCFYGSGIDVLVLGNCIITEKPEAAVEERAGYELSDAMEAELSSGAVRPRGALPFAGGPKTSSGLATPTRAADASGNDSFEGTQAAVLDFYKELPFNYYSGSIDIASELLRSNRIREYSVVHSHLKTIPGGTLIDVGCGSGWFVNSCSHYYGVRSAGLDLNPVVLKQARSAARFMPGCEDNEFLEGSVFEFEPEAPFDVVNSLGVLHHTPDCHSAIRRILPWVAPQGYLHLGLYHLYGRRPFLKHFGDMKKAGVSDQTLYQEYKRLNPSVTDELHLASWFRDQVLHPHESQHTYAEIEALLNSEGFVVEATSLNRFKRVPTPDKMEEVEQRCEAISQRALRRGIYYPGFFSVWARRK